MKNKYVKTLFLLLLFLGVVGSAQTVSGLVTSDDGPLPGATIVIKGTINSATELLQGKVAGLSIYNRGGNPNGSAVIRLRGLSSVGSNIQPLVVIDGIVGGSLENLDPNDIESINVLKDGSAAAIYGTRGSSGVILVTTKKGKNKRTEFNYNGQFSTAAPFDTVNVLSAEEFVAAGGTDLGSNTDWTKEVIRSTFTHIHNFSASGGHHDTTYRIAANLRDVEGILRNSGFEQFNARANFSSFALDDRLKIDFNSSFTRRDQDNGFSEALRYAILYNPTAPIYGDDSPFPFNSEQFGGYFESLGLFDAFNPVSIIHQNQNTENRIEFNYGLNLNYRFSDSFSANLNLSQQESKYSNKIYYPTTSHFRGNATSPIRKGRADLFEEKKRFKLEELYGTYNNTFDQIDLTFTGGILFSNLIPKGSFSV